MAFPDKPAELTERVLDSVKAGRQAPIEAVRKFDYRVAPCSW